jgi:hypothetical protein
MAAAQANNQMSITQTQMILAMGFSTSKDKNGNEVYEPIMLNMTLTRTALTEDASKTPPVETTPVETTIRLPLLTIMPINALGVDSVDVTFDMEVKSSYSHTTSNSTVSKTQAEASFDAKFGGGLWSVTIHGSVSHSTEHKTAEDSQYQKSNSARYHVAVHAGQLPVPDGIKTIIQAYANAITPIQLPVVKKEQGDNTPS